MTTKRSAAAATIFSRRWAPPPPLISQPSGVTWSVPSIAMSSRSQLAELLDRDAQPARLFLGRDRGGDAADAAQAARGDRRQQVGDGRAGARARPSSRPRPAPPPPRRRSASRRRRSRPHSTPAARTRCILQRRRRAAIYARGEMDARIWLTGEGGEPRSVALRPSARSSAATPRPRIQHRRRGGLLEPPRDREPRRRADGDRPRQPQRHRAQRRAARPPAPPARRRHPDRRRPPARSLRPGPGPGRRRRWPPAAPVVALNEEERATAAALVAPYRSEGAFAGRPATRAEIAEALHVSERTAQRRLDALAAKLDVSGEAGRDRPRLIAARVIELGLDRAR